CLAPQTVYSGRRQQSLRVQLVSGNVVDLKFGRPRDFVGHTGLNRQRRQPTFAGDLRLTGSRTSRTILESRGNRLGRDSGQNSPQRSVVKRATGREGSVPQTRDKPMPVVAESSDVRQLRSVRQRARVGVLRDVGKRARSIVDREGSILTMSESHLDCSKHENSQPVGW